MLVVEKAMISDGTLSSLVLSGSILRYSLPSNSLDKFNTSSGVHGHLVLEADKIVGWVGLE